MSQIYEIYGYRLTDESPEARKHRANAWCPFMDSTCDGGGNRAQSEINLTKKEHFALSQLYPNREKLMPGVCSLTPNSTDIPWIVCPRRLFVLGRQKSDQRTLQRELEARLLSLFSYYPSGTRLGVWKEVKLSHRGENNGLDKEFDYTFDYVVMPIGDVSLHLVHQNLENTDKHRLFLERHGFPMIQRDGEWFVQNYPYGTPSIVEIMTCSTSGGNKNTRSQIPQAFEDAIQGSTHKAPGINYRQVWARMASQLLVKSEVALGWGGRAIWIVQDVLVEYINKTTGLNIRKLIGSELDAVNMLSFSYGDISGHPQSGVIDLPMIEFFSGSLTPISDNLNEQNTSFADIIRSPIQPPLNKLVSLLTRYGPTEYELKIP